MSGKDWIRFWTLGIIWGTSFLWIKIAVGEITPLVLVSFRTLFAALGLLLILWFSKSVKWDWHAIRPVLGVYFVLGLINVALPFVLISWSEQYIDSGLAAILNSTVPLWTILIAPWLVPDDRFSFPKLAGLLVGFVGVIVIFLPEISGGSLGKGFIGQIAMLLATLSYACGTIYARLKTKGFHPQIQSLLQFIMATLIMWTFTLSVDRPIKMPQTPIVWVGLLWLGLIGSCLAYLLYFGLLHSIGPTRTTLVTYIPPLVGVILGVVFLGEQLYWQVILGGALIISGIALVNFPGLFRMRKNRPAEP